VNITMLSTEEKNIQVGKIWN